jgi:UDP-N-acetylmuramoyl-L-alanyl-D-glutamate--2,6-diaminopimelate ligase
MRLAELMAGLPVRGAVDAPVEVTGVQHDSRAVVPGDLFVALRGARFDGARYAPQAVERGGVAVLSASTAPADVAVAVPWVVAEEPRALLAPLAHRVWGHPETSLTMVGVTGTNGKSTVVWLCQAMLEAVGLPCGRIGTVSYAFGGVEQPAQRTTPEVSDLVHLLHDWQARGAVALCMEASSHALVLDRLGELRFDVGVFTNLTRDHLDFHGTMEAYFAAKRRLFSERLKAGSVAAINVGDPWGAKLAGELRANGTPTVTFGAGGDVRAEDAALDWSGIRARVVTPRGTLALASRLLGPFNLENLLAAVAVGEALRLPLATVEQALREVAPVPGRMESVDRGQGFPVFVDYAHTDDGLRNALGAVRAIAGARKVAVVFGCGGDRDPGKRPLMGQVAGELADLVLVTSDNPRGEDPQQIMAAIEQGVKASGNRNYRMLPDRRDAIRRAIAKAGPDWAVLIAGKGNEDGQEIAGKKLPFSDRDEAAKALEERAHAAQRE